MRHHVLERSGGCALDPSERWVRLEAIQLEVESMVLVADARVLRRCVARVGNLELLAKAAIIPRPSDVLLSLVTPRIP